MEEKKKLSSVIIILTTLLLGVFSYIGYDKFITKDNKDSNSDKTKENTENNSYNIYNMIYTSENSHSLAVNKDNTGYEEIAHNISVIPDAIIGIYNNNLYYSALDGVYYIDLSDSNYKLVKWLSYNQYKTTDNGVIKIFALEESEKYIVDGNITSKIPDSKYIEVKMLDGTLKKYNIDDSVSSDYKEVLE